MGLLDAVPFVGPALDAASGIISANQARNAFKSRYQDTVKDMRKAGLNPALAYGQGGGNPQTSDLPNVGESLVKATQGAASARQARANAELTEAQTDVYRAQAEALRARPFLENAQISAQTAESGARRVLLGEDTNLRRLQGVGQQAENTAAGIRNQILTIDRQIRELDRDYASASFEDRVTAVRNAAAQSGLSLTETETRIALNRAGLVPKASIAEGVTGAKQLVEAGAEISATTLERLKEGVANWWNKQKRNQIRFRGKANRALGTDW